MDDIIGKENFNSLKNSLLEYLLKNEELYENREILITIKNLSNITSEELDKEQIFKIQVVKNRVFKSEKNYDISWTSIFLLNLFQENSDEADNCLIDLDINIIDLEILELVKIWREFAILLYKTSENKLISEFDQLLSRLPNGINIEYIIKEFLDQEIDQETLLGLCDITFKHCPNNHNLYYQKASICENNDQYEEAIRCYQTCLEICLNRSELSSELCDLYNRIAYDCLILDRNEEAINAATLALSTYEKFIKDGYEKIFKPFVLATRAKAYVNISNYESARNDVKLGLSLDDTNFELSELEEIINEKLNH